MNRVGHGFDVHPFMDDRPLILGGVVIPHPRGLGGHSDADVLIHAICDACLGAAGRGDIGRHFPDSDPHYRGIDSRILLRRVREILTESGWQVVNLDSTLVAQTPKLAPYLEAMRRHLAEDLCVAVDKINIKATTTEYLGFTGREEGIAAHAVVLIANRWSDLPIATQSPSGDGS